MITALWRAHRGRTALFYLDVSLDETLRRHAGRPQASQFGAEDMRGWYAPRDVLGLPDERVITETSSKEDSVALIASTVGVRLAAPDPPVKVT